MPIVIIFILSIVMQNSLSWWIIIPICLIVGYILTKSAKEAFIAGLVGVGGLWLMMATHSYYRHPPYISRISEMFSLPHPLLLVVLAAMIGGIVAGMASCTGFYLAKALGKR